MPYIFNAAMGSISPSMVRHVLAELEKRGEKPDEAETSIEQVVAWENCGVTITAILTKLTGDSAFPHSNPPARTIGGIPLTVKKDANEHMILFKKNGNEVGRIEALQIPQWLT